MISRRVFLLGAAAASVSSRAQAAAARSAPALFVQHGPYFPLDAEKRAPLESWARTLAPVRGIVAMTPHFGGRALTFGPAGPAQLLYNVPDDIARLLPKDLRYPAPADDGLAERAASLLGETPPRTTKTGLEHTLWMPLYYLYPAARAPILQLSFPLSPGSDLFALGAKLAPLTDEGIAVVGSGSISHNLALWAAHENKERVPRPSWVEEFTHWTEERLVARDVDALRDWQHRAPAARLNHPDGGEHFRVLLFALGAKLARGGSAPIRLSEKRAGVQIG
jgi:4,5-DOPA dioxygenase extradiol